MGQFVVDVSSILAEAGSSLELDDEVPLESLTVGDTVAVFEGRPRIRATLSNTGDALLLYGTISATARLECSRCLEPFERVLEGSLEGVLSSEEERADVADDQEWYPLDAEGRTDLLPAIEAALAIEFPYAPVHDEECRGICPTCGCDLNRDVCHCVRVSEDDENPFAVLKDLIGTDEGP